MNKPSPQPRSSAYGASFARHGQSPKAMQWASYRAAAIRYRQLVKGLNFEAKSILDAGCGMGDLLPYIYAQSDSFEYLGVDVTPEFIEVAQTRYLGQSFKVANPFSKDFAKNKFDIVLSSGVMNANSPGWMSKRQQMIAALFRMTKQTLAFNMAGGIEAAAFSTKSRVAYANANEVADFCKTLTPKVELQTDYHPKDFTVVMQR